MKTNKQPTAAAVSDTAATTPPTLKEKLDACQTLNEQILVLAAEIELLQQAKN